MIGMGSKPLYGIRIGRIRQLSDVNIKFMMILIYQMKIKQKSKQHPRKNINHLKELKANETTLKEKQFILCFI